MADDNLSDQLADTITTHSVNVLRVAAGLRNDVLDALKKLQTQLIKDIEDHGPNPREAALLKQTNESIASAYSDIADTHADSLVDIATAETEQAANLVNNAIGVETATVATSQKALETIAGKTLLEGHYPAQWWAGQSTDLQDRFAGEMRQGMLQGEGVDKLVQRVRGTQSLGYTDGIMQASRAQAEALVRTSVMSVANEARISTYKENGDVIKGIQWLSTLDSRTTAICRALDGLEWDLNYKPIGHKKAFPGPIAHWGCRSTQIPITFSWAELSGKKVGVDDKTLNQALIDKVIKAGGDKAEASKLVAKTRASMDGQVSAGLNFGDWVSTKPEAFQDQVLGTQQAQLYRAGKITMKDLTDQGNRPLTVSQLQNLATKKQLVPVKQYADNQNGFTLHQRQISEDQLATLQATQQELSTYLNNDTGAITTVSGSLLTDKASSEIDKNDATTVLKTSLTPQDLVTPFELRQFAKHDVDEVKVTLLNGSTIQIDGKITDAVADEVAKRLSLAKVTDKRIVEALRGAGLTVTKTRAGTIAVQVVKPLE